MKRRYSLGSVICLMLLAAAVTFIITFVEVMGSAARLGGQTGGAEGQELHRKFGRVLSYLEQYYVGPIDEMALSDETMRALVDSLGDQWSHYLNEEEYANYVKSSEDSYVGIGVTVSWREDGSALELTKVNAGAPALEAGLKVGEKIVAVEGVSLQELGHTEAVSRVRGEEGTFVTLTVQGTDGKLREVRVERRSVAVRRIQSELLGEMGYVRIENFETGAYEEFRAAVEDLLKQGARALVFDVRVNPGGRLDELKPMLDMLLPEGPIFISRTKEQREKGEQRVLMSDEEELQIPMAVLVNEYSYSAAEFFAAALQEYDKAEILGSHTTGKGYAQVAIDLEDGTALVLSIEEYFTPNGVSLAEAGGIAPDYEVPMSEEQLARFTTDHEDDPVLEKALEVLAHQLQKAG